MGTYSRGNPLSLTPTGDEERFEEMYKVVDLYVQNINPTQIARELNLKRVDVMKHLDEWKSTAIGSEIMQERMQELVVSMDQHYSKLINKFYEIVEEVDGEAGSDAKGRPAYLAQKSSALRSIADLEAKRLDLLDKAGLRADGGIADELMELQDYLGFLENIIDEVICEKDREKIKQKIIQRHTGREVVIVK